MEDSSNTYKRVYGCKVSATKDGVTTVFKSICEAARFLNCDNEFLRKKIYVGAVYRGYVLKCLDSVNYNKIITEPSYSCKPMVVVDSVGNTYKFVSITHAASYFGVSNTTIQKSLKYNKPVYNGLSARLIAPSDIGIPYTHTNIK